MNDRREVIREKSEYKRTWRLREEIKFRWILYKLKGNASVSCKKVSPQLKDMLGKYGKHVEKVGGKFEIW